MAKVDLDAALKWIVSGNAEVFRQDFDVIIKKFPNLDEADLNILRGVHENGISVSDSAGDLSDDELDAVVGGASSRSHGW